MAEVIQVALEEGATTINVPDTVGYTMPREYAAMFDELYRLVPGLRRGGRLGALPRRPGTGGRELAGGCRSRLPAGRVRDQRDRRARGQRVAGGDRDAAAHARAEPRPVDGDRDDRDRAHQPSGLAPDGLSGAAQQGDRRAQRVRARGRHPPGRRAEGAHHLRDHGRHDRRAEKQLARAGQALRASRAARRAGGDGVPARRAGAEHRLQALQGDRRPQEAGERDGPGGARHRRAARGESPGMRWSGSRSRRPRAGPRMRACR